MRRSLPLPSLPPLTQDERAFVEFWNWNLLPSPLSYEGQWIRRRLLETGQAPVRRSRPHPVRSRPSVERRSSRRRTGREWGLVRIAYADPPYPGQSKKHYGDHPDYAGEVDHRSLAKILGDFDGWILHTSAPAGFYVQGLLARQGEYPMDAETFKGGTYRPCVWVKTFCAFKRNVPLAYAHEPVFIKPCRKQVVGGEGVSRDWIAEPITMKRGLVGAKPERVVHWALRAAGVQQDDEVVDLYPGSGAVQRAWESYRDQGVLA